MDTDGTGRQLVRERLLRRCDEAGLVKPRKLTAEAFDRYRDRLVEAFDHMSAENLDTLAEIVIDASDDKRPEWPVERQIRHLAAAIEPRPFAEKRIVKSWLSSVEGPLALSGGYLVELYRHLRARGTPPGKFDVVQMREEAANNRRMLAAIAGRRARSSASRDDIAWAEAYARDAAAAEDIVAAGAARRVNGGDHAD